MDNIVYKAFEITENLKIEIEKSLIEEMPNHDIEKYFSSKSNIFDDSAIITLALNKNKIIGLIILSKVSGSDGEEGVYIRTLLISERFHGYRVSYELVCNAFKNFVEKYQLFPDHILMTTYNPITYKMMYFFSNSEKNKVLLYPDIINGNSEKSKNIAKSFSKSLSPEKYLDTNTGVIVNGGGDISSSFWSKPPLTSNSKVMDYFRSNLNYRDRLLCILYCTERKDKETIMDNLKINYS